MIPQTLIRYIETEIIPRYEHFDKAHNLSHVQTVIDESLALAKLYPQADERLVYTIAAYHDTGLCRDRATHHLVSGEIIAADANLLQWFDKAEIKIMREAVQYGLKQNPTADEAWHYQRFHKHLMEKYAPGGYLKLWFSDSKNAGRLKELQTIIADEIRLRSIFHQMFEEEKR